MLAPTALTSTVPPQGIRLRERINATHGAILVILGLAFSVNCLLGSFAGIGGYPFLLTNSIGAVGLLQAYLLMALIGVSLLVARSTTKPLPRAWNWIAIGAHVPPLLAVALYTGSTPEMAPKVVLLSLLIHGSGIGAELFALSRRITA